MIRRPPPVPAPFRGHLIVTDPRVFIAKCTGYDPPAVQQAVGAAFQAFGGASALVGRGDRVLVKPNMLMAAPAERAVTTHPAVVEAVLRLLLDAGAHVVVGDSPGWGSAARAAERCGIAEIARRLGVDVVELDDPVEVRPQGSLFRRFEIARAALEADAIINLPKFKTHGQMTLTMAVKNLFGCVAGHRKAQWHMHAGRDREAFARMLLELARLLAPRFSLVDGVIGMDGNGPSSGRARRLGVILAGTDPLAIDRIAARLVRLPEERFPLLRAARASDTFQAGLGRIETIGEPVENCIVDGFELPESVDVEFGPRLLRKTIRRAMAARPTVDHAACKRCLACVNACPPRAMALENDRIRIDYHRCISCFCCQEMCPERAIGVRRGWLARLLIRSPREKIPASGLRTFDIPGTTEQIQAVARQLVELYTRLKIPEEKICSLKLALDEAVTNAVEHGHGGDCSRNIRITCRWKPGWVTLTVGDQGNGFDLGGVADPTTKANLLKESGRGLYIIASIMSDVTFNDKGNEISMTLRTNGESRS